MGVDAFCTCHSIRYQTFKQVLYQNKNNGLCFCVVVGGWALELVTPGASQAWTWSRRRAGCPCISQLPPPPSICRKRKLRGAGAGVYGAQSPAWRELPQTMELARPPPLV